MRTIKRQDRIMVNEREDRVLVARVRMVGVREVARRAKTSATTVSQWIRGKLALPRSTADRITKAAT